MIKYFPTPYQDEVLYSILARYHIHSGNQGIATTLVDLFNTKKITAIIDFPCSLSQLSKNLNDRFLNCQPEKLISNHTLYPFFKPFWSGEKADYIFKLMKDKSSGDIHLKAGTYASGIKQWKYLRYCPECIKGDVRNLGEAYWHRIHQLPGVLICPMHNVPTYNSNIRTYEINQQFYYIINKENCNMNNTEETFYNSELSSKLHLLSEDVKWVLDNGTTIQTAINHKAAYIDILKSKGLISKKGQVDQDTFINEFVQYYGREFLESLGLSIDYDNTHNWVSMMVRKNSQEPHPLKHLLMIRFLFSSAKEYFINYTKFEPFFKGPYPCLNVTAEHYKTCTIDDIKIEYSRNKRPYAIFSCSCGFCYIRNGPDKQETDKYRYDSILFYGDAWKEKFKELVEIKELPLREVGRILKIDLKTVRKNIDRLGLRSKWMISNVKKIKNEIKALNNSEFEELNMQMRKFYRGRWLWLRDNNSNLLKTHLRKLDKKTYNWLYYHDKDWLDYNSPKSVNNFSSRVRVDWRKRDSEIREEAEIIVRKLLSQNNKPVRISIERIGKELGQLFLLRNNLDRLPNTKLYLDSVLENKQKFYVRKIKWAISKLGVEQASVSNWKVKQLIGLYGTKSEDIEKLFNNEISKCNQGYQDNSS